MISRIVLKIDPRHGITPPWRHDDPETPWDDTAPREFVISEGGVIVFTDGIATSLDDGSRVNLEMEVYDEIGRPMRIDLDPRQTPPGQTNHPEYLGMFRFEARRLDDEMLLGSIGGKGLSDDAHFEGPVHFINPSPPKPPGNWKRSGGVWCTAAVREACFFQIVGPDESGPGSGVISNRALIVEVR